MCWCRIQLDLLTKDCFYSISNSSPKFPLSVLVTEASLLLSRTQGYCYRLSKFHIYALVYCIGVFLSGLLHSVSNRESLPGPCVPMTSTMSKDSVSPRPGSCLWQGGHVEGEPELGEVAARTGLCSLAGMGVWRGADPSTRLFSGTFTCVVYGKLRTGESGAFGLWPYPRGSSRISS